MNRIIFRHTNLIALPNALNYEALVMWDIKSVWVGTLLLSFLLASIATQADDQYPPVPLSSDDLRIIVNPRIETDFIMHLIAGAKTRIRLATFHFQPDDLVGWPVLKELERKAADINSPVKVEFFTSNFAGWNGDVGNYVGYFLDYISSYTSLEYVLLGSSMTGWNHSDGSHAKELIIDDEIMLVSGRGYGKSYHSYFDIAYAFKGELVKQSVLTFKNMWKDIHKVNPTPQPTKNDLSPEMIASERKPDPDMKPYWDAFVPRDGLLSRGDENNPLSEKHELKSLKEWADTPVSGEGVVLQARTVHHRFLNQMDLLPKQPKQYNYATRLSMLEDSIVDAVARRIKRAHREIKIMSFTLAFHPTIKAALIGALARGVDIEIISNGKAAHSKVLPWWTLWTPIGYYLSLPDGEDLLSTGSCAKVPGNLTIRLFKAQNAGSDFIYSHAKLIIVDDVTFFGSSNLTVSSTVVQEEVQWEIKGKELSDRTRKIFEEARVYTDVWTSAQATCERGRYWNRFQGSLFSSFSWLY